MSFPKTQEEELGFGTCMRLLSRPVNTDGGVCAGKQALDTPVAMGMQTLESC